MYQTLNRFVWPSCVLHEKVGSFNSKTKTLETAVEKQLHKIDCVIWLKSPGQLLMGTVEKLFCQQLLLHFSNLFTDSRKRRRTFDENKASIFSESETEPWMLELKVTLYNTNHNIYFHAALFQIRLHFRFVSHKILSCQGNISHTFCTWSTVFAF